MGARWRSVLLPVAVLQSHLELDDDSVNARRRSAGRSLSLSTFFLAQTVDQLLDY